MAISGFGLNGAKYFSNIVKPIAIHLNFVVDSTNGNGLGCRSLKSNGAVKDVQMHTTATPPIGNSNPAVGYAVIQMQQNFQHFVGLSGGQVSTVSGSAVKVDNSALSIGQPYVITTLGNASAAQWIVLGVPAGVTPAVGVAFVAIATTAGTANTSTSRVMVPKASGIQCIEVVGNSALATTSKACSFGGQYIMVSFLAPTVTSVTDAFKAPMIPTAPVDGSVVAMTLVFDGSSVTIDGI